MSGFSDQHFLCHVGKRNCLVGATAGRPYEKSAWIAGAGTGVPAWHGVDRSVSPRPLGRRRKTPGREKGGCQPRTTVPRLAWGRSLVFDAPLGGHVRPSGRTIAAGHGVDRSVSAHPLGRPTNPEDAKLVVGPRASADP